MTVGTKKSTTDSVVADQMIRLRYQLALNIHIFIQQKHYRILCFGYQQSAFNLHLSGQTQRTLTITSVEKKLSLSLYAFNSLNFIT